MSVLETSHQGLSQKDILFARESAWSGPDKGTHCEATLTLEVNGRPVPQGSCLNQIMRSCLELIAEGRPVAVMPMEDEIGTQEAADLLKVSRPYMVKLLDARVLPSRKVGVRRRVRTQDVLDYQAREKAERIKVLEELADEGQRLNLGE